MADDTSTLSERIGALADVAYDLYTDIKQLRKEVEKREGIESIEYLSDVPGELKEAEESAKRMNNFLESAEDCATKGGD